MTSKPAYLDVVTFMSAWRNVKTLLSGGSIRSESKNVCVAGSNPAALTLLPVPVLAEAPVTARLSQKTINWQRVRESTIEPPVFTRWTLAAGNLFNAASAAQPKQNQKQK